MVHTKKFSAEDRAKFAALYPEEYAAAVAAQEQAMQLLMSGKISLSQKFEICPVCGQKSLPVEFRRGSRSCRNCCHYDKENFTAESRASTLADSRAWWTSHRKAVA